jgi:hypothetical protein
VTATGQWFSLGTPVSSTNKTDCHNVTKILLKGALNTITLTLTLNELMKILLLPPHLENFFSPYFLNFCHNFKIVQKSSENDKKTVVFAFYLISLIFVIIFKIVRKI